MFRARAAIAVLLVAASGCGGGGGRADYEREASALCREFNAAAGAEIADPDPDPDRVRGVYDRLGDGLAELAPPEELRRTHAVLTGFARAGEELSRDLARGAPSRGDRRPLDLEWVDDLPRVARDLPACDLLVEGAHPEIQVIR